MVHHHAALFLLLLLLRRKRRRNRQRRYRRCLRCNPNAIVEISPESSSDCCSQESEDSSSLGECSCTSNNSSLVTDVDSSEKTCEKTPSPTKPQAPVGENKDPKVIAPVGEKKDPKVIAQVGEKKDSKVAPVGEKKNPKIIAQVGEKKDPQVIAPVGEKKDLKVIQSQPQRPPLQVAHNVQVDNFTTTETTMRRYPSAQEDAPFKYLVRQTREVMCPPMGTGESYSRHMAEIEYWVKTHRPPCTYRMLPAAAQATESANTQKGAPNAKINDNRFTDANLKRSIDANVTPAKRVRKNVTSTCVEEESTKPKSVFFTSTPESPQRMLNKANGSCLRAVAIEKKAKSKNLNGDTSTAAKKYLCRQKSTPVTSRTKNIIEKIEKRTNAVSRSLSKSRTATVSKATVAAVGKAVVDTAEYPEASAGPSHAVESALSRDVKPVVVDDSDTSVLTAPYIRSTRNSASKSKCQSLTRQRANQGKGDKYFATRSLTKSQKDILNNVSAESKESNAADKSKLTSDSSLDIFGGDLTKESSNSRKSTLRSSSGNKLPTLHFSMVKAPVKRRSEPAVTRTSAKRALATSCETEAPAGKKELNGLSKRIASEPTVSRTGSNTSRCKVAAVFDEEKTIKKKFFL